MSDPVTHLHEEEDLRQLDPTRSLFLVSVVGLFLELMLIRWVSCEVRVFAYLQNTVLVVCFLGLGVGCLTSRRPVCLRQTFLRLALLGLLLAVPYSQQLLATITNQLSALGDFVIWGAEAQAAPGQAALQMASGLALTYLLLWILVGSFVPLGRLTGRLMDDSPDTVWAYSVNVTGALLGSWLFVGVSALNLPPGAWAALAALLLLWFVRREPRRLAVNALLAAVFVAGAFVAGGDRSAVEVVWSPYQKLVLYEHPPVAGSWGGYQVMVNNVGYQSLADLRDETVTALPDCYPPELRGVGPYDVPYLFHANPRSTAIFGAGAGNDVARALAHGVERVVAVEIDPAIVDMGRRWHPEHPYQDPRVHVVVDDARSYLATSTERFDVIVFGLLDAHTDLSQTNVRLDSFVYTRESMARAHALLAPGGVLVLKFFAKWQFLVDRMARVLREEFGEEPEVYIHPHSSLGTGAVTFIAGDVAGARARMAAHPRLPALMAAWKAKYPIAVGNSAEPTTDDWPYLYLAKPHVPVLYYLLALVLLVLLQHARVRYEAARNLGAWGRSHWHFFLLGAAFMLLETQNISKASVCLGHTWVVNAIVISGVLVMVLLANALVARWPSAPAGGAMVCLLMTCGVLYFVNLAAFTQWPQPTKSIVVGLLSTLPMLFSGVLFIQSFKAVPNKAEVLGANLFGALAGALLQSASFVLGLRALLLLVAALYALAWVARPQRT